MIDIGVFAEMHQNAKTIGASALSISKDGLTIQSDGLWVRRKTETEIDNAVNIIPNLQVRVIKKMASDFTITNGEATGKDKAGKDYSFPLSMADECDSIPCENNVEGLGSIESNSLKRIASETVKTKNANNYWYFANKSAYSLILSEYYSCLIKGSGEFNKKVKYAISKTLCAKLTELIPDGENFKVSAFECWDNKYLKFESTNFLIYLEVGSSEHVPAITPIVKVIPKEFPYNITGEELEQLIVSKPTVAATTELRIDNSLISIFNSATANEVLKALRNSPSIKINKSDKFTFFTDNNSYYIVGNARV